MGSLTMFYWTMVRLLIAALECILLVLKTQMFDSIRIDCMDSIWYLTGLDFLVFVFWILFPILPAMILSLLEYAIHSKL